MKKSARRCVFCSASEHDDFDFRVKMYIELTQYL